MAFIFRNDTANKLQVKQVLGYTSKDKTILECSNEDKKVFGNFLVIQHFSLEGQ